jgi:zinc protease
MNKRSLKNPLKLVPLLVLSLSPLAHAIDVLVERDSRLPIAHLNVVIRTGSIADPARKTGLTNFLGDMLLRGTQRHTKEEIDLLLDQWGASLGVETRTESMVVRGSVLSAKLPDFLGLVREVLSQPLFPENEISKLKQETISGILAQQGNDHALVTRKFGEFLFEKHPYGRPIDGLPSEVSTFDRAALVRQHLAVFRKEALLVLGVGDVTEGTLKSWAGTLASSLPTRAGAPLPVAPKPEFPPVLRLEIVDKPDRTQTQILIGQAGIRMTDPDYYALYLGNVAFGGGSFTSRLMQEIRVKRGWSYGARSNFRFSLQPRSWQVHLFPAEKDTPAALATTLAMIDELRGNGISEKEFALAKQSSINSAAFINDTPKKRIENRILEETLQLPQGFFSGLAKNLEKVRLADVNQALSRFITPDRLTISILGTASRLKKDLADKAGIPADKVVVVPYTAE